MPAGRVKDARRSRSSFSVDIRLHGYAIRVETDDRRIIRAVKGSLDTGSLPRTPGDARRKRLSLRLSARPMSPAVHIPPRGEAAAAFENVELHVSDRRRLLVIDRTSFVVIDPLAGCGEGHVAPEHLDSGWIIAHRILYLSVIEILRCRWAYYIHAGCVCDGEKGVLICGASGSGKSTLTYALARSGYAFLSDDGVFIHARAGHLEVFAFPEKIKLDARSCSFFEELGHPGGGDGKAEIALRDTAVRKSSSSARPVALIFPVRSDGPKSRIGPLPGHQALAQVLGQSIPLLTPAEFERQFELLTELVKSCRCFELSAARDFDEIPALVAGAVDARA